MKKAPSFILYILTIALILRAALLAFTYGNLERAIEPDTTTYIEPAVKLLRWEGFIDDGHRTPIYPLFIALFYWIFGEQILPIIIAQIILSVLTVFIAYLIGKMLLSEKIGLIAAILMAISIESITNSYFLLSETLFTALFLGSILFYIVFRQTNQHRWIIISGGLMGLSILCRPIAVYFPLMFLILILFDHARTKRIRFLRAGLYTISFSIILIPWIFWNNSAIGVPTLTTISNYNLLFYNAASLQAHQSEMEIEVVRDNLRDVADKILSERGLPDTPANRSSVNHELALSIILANPFRYIYLHFKNDLNNFLPSVTDLTEILGVTVGGKGTLAILNQEGLLAAINHYFEGNFWLIGLFIPAIVLLFLIYVSDLVGIGLMIVERKWFALAILFLPILYLMLIPGAPSNQRFRAPAMPFICLLAAQGFLYIWVTTKSLLGKKSILGTKSS